MHLIKATVLKAILTGAAATATVSAGVVLTAAAVEYSTGKYAEASGEIESGAEDITSNDETYVPRTIVAQEGNDDADSYLMAAADSGYETGDAKTAHDNMAEARSTDISSPAKTADPGQTAGSPAGAAGHTGSGSAVAGGTVNTAAIPGSIPGSTADNTGNTAVDHSSMGTAANEGNGSGNATASTDSSSVNTAANNGNGSGSTAANAGNTTANADNGSTAAGNGSGSTAANAGNGSGNTAASAPSAADADNSPVSTAANTGNGSDTASPSAPAYDRTTSIYDDDGALMRVEYYVEGQNLPAEYSSVADYDKDTNSYTETVYRYDEENDASVVVRTDTYANGELVSSEVP